MGMAVFFAPISAAKLEELRKDPDSIEQFLYRDDDGEDDSFDVDKAWHGLHYVLTGTAWGGDGPLAMAILGGTEIGEDLGMGPARFLTPAQVREVAAALADLKEADLRARFDPQRMAELDIYPTIWLQEGDEAFEYLMENFHPMVEFYAGAAARGDGVILSLG